MEKAIALLSGGIDSPVAIAKLKNKLDITAIHFHQMPLTNEKEVEKVKQLSNKLNIKVHIIPFVNVFKEIVEKCDHRHYYVLSKILMFQYAANLAKKEGAKYLITGENLAQVSSQTLSCMRAIDEQVNLTILRPLLTWDKQEIVDKAKELGTYDISKGPEICSLLGPKNPVTKTSKEKVQNELNKLTLP